MCYVKIKMKYWEYRDQLEDVCEYIHDIPVQLGFSILVSLEITKLLENLFQFFRDLRRSMIFLILLELNKLLAWFMTTYLYIE
jgi:hypothetical protein